MSSATATITSIAVDDSPAVEIPAQDGRESFLIANDTNKNLWVAFGSTATTSNYSVKLAAGGSFNSLGHDYTGPISMIGEASPTGEVKFTAFTG